MQVLCCDNSIIKQLQNRKINTNMHLAHKYHNYIKHCIDKPNQKKCKLVKKDIKLFEMYLDKLDKVIENEKT
jgi:hypothetical protein